MKQRKAKFLMIMTMFLVFGAVPSLAHAGARDLVVIRPGGPSPSDEAQKQIDNLAKQLAKKAGWDEGATTGRYFNDESEGLAYIKQTKPGFVLGTLGFYLKHKDSLGLRVINQGIVHGKTESQFYLVAREGTLKSLADLKGKTLAGTHLQEPEFIERIVLNHALTFGTDVKVQAMPSLRALRKCNKGEVDAVILDEKEMESLSDLPFGSQLEPFFASKPLPNTGFMAIQNGPSAADIKSFAAATAAFCSFEDGKTICKDFDIQGFKPVNDSFYEKIRTQYKGK